MRYLHELYDYGIIEYSRYSDIREKTVKLIEQVKDLPEEWDMMTPDEKITDFVDFQLLEKLRRLVGNVYFDFVRELIRGQ